MKKIELLTQEQIARFPEFVEKWTRIGLCTDAADRPRAEAAIRESYRRASLDPPKKIVWCGSPLSQGLTRAIILGKKLTGTIGASVRESIWDSVRGSVWANVVASVGASVRASVWDSVEASVRASVAASVAASVGASVRASVAASVGASVRASVAASVGASVRESVADSVRASTYGSHDANWLAFHRYFFEVCQLRSQTEKLGGLWNLAQSAGWALPHANICWISERHHILERDERGRLHCLKGPAVMYPDGWAIYAVHGVRVPADVIETPVEKFTAERVIKEPNAEVRRIFIERIGNEGFIALTGAKAIHEDRRGKLYRIELEGDEPLVAVQVVNSTPEPDGHFKSYLLRVPPTVRTAQEAVAWTFGLKANEYAPAQET